jgi:hypothetical protein
MLSLKAVVRGEYYVTDGTNTYHLDLNRHLLRCVPTVPTSWVWSLKYAGYSAETQKHYYECENDGVATMYEMTVLPQYHQPDRKVVSFPQPLWPATSFTLQSIKHKDSLTIETDYADIKLEMFSDYIASVIDDRPIPLLASWVKRDSKTFDFCLWLDFCF